MAETCRAMSIALAGLASADAAGCWKKSTTTAVRTAAELPAATLPSYCEDSCDSGKISRDRVFVRCMVSSSLGPRVATRSPQSEECDLIKDQSATPEESRNGIFRPPKKKAQNG